MRKSTVLGLCLTLMALMPVSAATIELNASYANVKQELFSKAEFNMNTLIVSGTAWHDSGFGFKVFGGKSSKTENDIATGDDLYTNTIDAIYGAMIVYKYNFGDLSLNVGVGKTDYKTTWGLNGGSIDYNDTGSLSLNENSADSGWSYSAGLSYPISSSLLATVNYTDIYRKNSEYGREKTTSTSVGISYLF